MAKKRSLKDVASAPLVVKDEIRMLSRDTALQAFPEKVSVPRKASRQKPAKSPSLRPSEATSAGIAKRGTCGLLAGIAVLILIGFVGGFFFGRFIKII